MQSCFFFQRTLVCLPLQRAHLPLGLSVSENSKLLKSDVNGVKTGGQTERSGVENGERKPPQITEKKRMDRVTDILKGRGGDARPANLLLAQELPPHSLQSDLGSLGAKEAWSHQPENNIRISTGFKRSALRG